MGQVVQEKDGILKKSEVLANMSSNYKFLFDKLLPGHTYNINVTAVRSIVTDTEESEPFIVTGTTSKLFKNF